MYPAPVPEAHQIEQVGLNIVKPVYVGLTRRVGVREGLGYLPVQTETALLFKAEGGVGVQEAVQIVHGVVEAHGGVKDTIAVGLGPEHRPLVGRSLGLGEVVEVDLEVVRQIKGGSDPEDGSALTPQTLGTVVYPYLVRLVQRGHEAHRSAHVINHVILPLLQLLTVLEDLNRALYEHTAEAYELLGLLEGQDHVVLLGVVVPPVLRIYQVYNAVPVVQDGVREGPELRE